MTAEDGVFAAWVGEAKDAMANSERKCSALSCFEKRTRVEKKKVKKGRYRSKEHKSQQSKVGGKKQQGKRKERGERLSKTYSGDFEGAHTMATLSGNMT